MGQGVSLEARRRTTAYQNAIVGQMMMTYDLLAVDPKTGKAFTTGEEKLKWLMLVVKK